MFNEQNPQIEVAYSKEEMHHILESLRLEGYHNDNIHIIAKDSSHFNDVKWDPDVQTHEVGIWLDQFKSWFTGESAVFEGLKRVDLTEGQVAYYAQLVGQGAILILAEHDEMNERVTKTISEGNRYWTDPLDPRFTAPEPYIDTIDHADRPIHRDEL